MNTYKFSGIEHTDASFAAMLRRLADAVDAGQAWWYSMEIEIPEPRVVRDMCYGNFTVPSGEPYVLTFVVKASEIVGRREAPNIRLENTAARLPK